VFSVTSAYLSVIETVISVHGDVSKNASTALSNTSRFSSSSRVSRSIEKRNEIGQYRTIVRNAEDCVILGPKGWSSPDLRDYGPVPDLPVVRLGDIPAPASEVDDTRAPMNEGDGPTPPIEVDDTRAPND
jgi:hypothetical protein